MKTICIFLGLLFITLPAFTQYVGIGINFPQEKLDVNGGIKIGSTTGTHEGTMRWNPDRNDFEGYNGSEWVSLTGNQGQWGRQDQFSYENSGTEFLLYHQAPDYGSNLGYSLDATDDFIYAGAFGDYTPAGLHGAGMVYVIARTSDHWKTYPDFLFSSPNPVAGEQFGYCVDRSTDYLVVGAPGWSQSKGRALIYSFDNNGHQVYHGSLYASDSNPEDRFGHSVSMTDDFAFASAPWREVTGIQNAGRLSIFRRDPVTNKFLFQTNITAPDATSGDAFGKALASSGNDVAVGAPRKTINGIVDQGKVYIYNWNGINWTLSQQIVSPEPAAYDRFGETLFLKGDTLFIAAVQSYSGIAGQNGRVYFYVRSGQQWIYQSTIQASDGGIYDYFGQSIFMKNEDLVIGASKANFGITEGCGKAYMFRFNGSAWVQQTILSASNRNFNDNFGHGVIIAGQTVVVAAPFAQIGEVNDNGRLYYFE